MTIEKTISYIAKKAGGFAYVDASGGYIDYDIGNSGTGRDMSLHLDVVDIVNETKLHKILSSLSSLSPIRFMTPEEMDPRLRQYNWKASLAVTPVDGNLGELLGFSCNDKKILARRGVFEKMIVPEYDAILFALDDPLKAIDLAFKIYRS